MKAINYLKDKGRFLIAFVVRRADKPEQCMAYKIVSRDNFGITKLNITDKYRFRDYYILIDTAQEEEFLRDKTIGRWIKMDVNEAHKKLIQD